MTGMKVKQLCICIPVTEPVNPWAQPSHGTLEGCESQTVLFKLFFNHNSEWDNWRLWCKISLAKASWKFTWPTIRSLHLCRLLVVALNFLSKVMKGQGPAGTEVHAEETASWKPPSLGQKDSKWNLRCPGVLSRRPSKRGQWSELSEAKLWSRQLGNISSQSTEQRTLSNFTRVGEFPWEQDHW